MRILNGDRARLSLFKHRVLGSPAFDHADAVTPEQSRPVP